MPSMPRVNKKSTDIAFKILGVPPNMAHKKTKRQKLIDEKNVVYNTRLVR